MHIVKVQSWLNGELATFEELASSFQQAKEKSAAHHEHHSNHSDSHTIKVYDDNGELVDSIEGSNTATSTSTYA
jgi:hypothetical protein